MATGPKQIEQLARTYTEAWCSHDPARVAARSVYPQDGWVRRVRSVADGDTSSAGEYVPVRGVRAVLVDGL